MYRRSILALLSSTLLLLSSPLAQELTPEHKTPVTPAQPFTTQPWNEMVDAKSSACILDFINNAKNAEEIAAKTEDDLDTAKLIIATRDAQDAKQLTSLSQLQAVWLASPVAFARLYCVCGPMVLGRWDTLPYQAPWSPVNTVLLKTGKVMFFEEANTVRTILWDPNNLVTPIFTPPDNDPQFSQWCSQTVSLGDGRILAVGGAGGGPNSNSDQAHIFNPTAGVNGVWTRIVDLNFERWYPSVVALGNGNHLVVGGVTGNGQTVAPMEMYNETSGLFTLVPGAFSQLLWQPLYPGLHQLPNGQIVFTRTGFAGNPPTPLTQFFVWANLASPVTGTWYDLGPLAFSERQEAMSFQFLEPTDDVYEQRSRVLVLGGGQSPVASSRTAEILDCENLTVGAVWKRLPDMVEPRNHAQGILLPDGQAIIWGGANHGNNGLAGSFSSELFNPCSNTFVRQDNLQYARGYHSGAALLPSGKVLATGGINGPLEKTMEIYSPPYLFKGARPVMTSIPSQAAHGQPFDIFTPQATQIDKVVLVRPVSNTHNTDSEQRVIQLRFSRDLIANKVTATMPNGVQPHPHAPRGHYLLFILNCNGVPSVGRFIHLN